MALQIHSMKTGHFRQLGKWVNRIAVLCLDATAGLLDLTHGVGVLKILTGGPYHHSDTVSGAGEKEVIYI